MKKIILLAAALVLFISCGDPKTHEPDDRLFNAWMYVGYKNAARDYGIVDQYYYDDDEIMEMFHFTSNALHVYTRGTFHPLVGIDYFDSTKITKSTLSVDDKTIQGDKINTFNYTITEKDNLFGLILSRTYQGYINIGGIPTPATIYSEAFLVKIDKDSLLATWPPLENDSLYTALD